MEKEMCLKAVIFDLDGVIVSTDEFHYQAWKKMADEEGIYFDRKINEDLRGVSRMESLRIVLKMAQKEYSNEEKVILADRKNRYYVQLLQNLIPDDILPGVTNVLKELSARNIKTAIASSSKNSPYILERIGLSGAFDVIADGNDIRNSKPDPEVFLLAAKRLGIDPNDCVGVEDAEAGIDSIIAANMKAVGVGYASAYPKAHYKVKDLTCIDVDRLLEKL
jgi:beta-phosphoglucomutase